MSPPLPPPLRAPSAALGLTGDQIVHIIEVLPATLMAVASLINSIKARRESACAADQAREAAREQIRFALRDTARRAVAAHSEGVATIADFRPDPASREEEESHARA